MRLVLVALACFVWACGEPQPDARVEPEPAPAVTTEMEEPTMGVHPGPIGLPNERMSAVMLDPRILEDPPDPTMQDPFANEAPLDLSIVEEE